MDAGKYPGRFRAHSSTTSSHLQPPAASPTAQYHHDGSGTDSVSDRDRDPSTPIHATERPPLGYTNPHGAIFDENASSYIHNRASVAPATFDVEPGAYAPIDISRDSLSPGLIQSGIDGRVGPAIQQCDPGSLPVATSTTALPVRTPRHLLSDLNVLLSDFAVGRVRWAKRRPQPDWLAWKWR